MPATSTKVNDVPSVEEVFGKYYDSEVFLALNRDQTKVIATGSTPQRAYANARRNGYKFPVIMKAPTSENSGYIL